MKISVTRGSVAAAKADAIAVGVSVPGNKLTGAARDLDKTLRGALASAIDDKGFNAEPGQIATAPGGKLAAKRVLLVGLGKTRGRTAETVRAAYAAAVLRASQGGLKSMAVAASDAGGISAREFADAVAQAATLAGYDPGLHRTRTQGRRVPLTRVSIVTGGSDLAELREGVADGMAMAEGTNLTRTLVNEPSNCLTPSDLARTARDLAREYSTVTCKVWGEKEIIKNGMGGLEGVGRGSEEPSQFIQLEYKPKGRKKVRTIAFVGKGITFDTGGISIKPAQGMELMKFDMGGAAAVIGAFKILAELEPDVRVLGYVAAAENMPSGRAIKPGDLLKMMSGLTVEVNNTDAEGRLVLADALHYATTQKPDFIVDAATLTGACMIALGDVACGLMSEDDDLVASIEAASQRCAEVVWRLPLMEAHRKKMEGHVADLKNTGPREGGALTAAGFLSNFTQGTPWAHLDIAGTVWTEENKAAFPKGATGFGAQLFAQIALGAAE